MNIKRKDRFLKKIKSIISLIFEWWNSPIRESLFYVGMMFLTIFGLVFIIMSRSIFGDDSVIIDAGTGKSSVVTVGSTEVMIVKKVINPNSQYAEIILRVDQPVTEVGISYEAIVGENEAKTLVSSKLTKIHDQYYLLQIENIPKKWRQLVVDFGYTSVEKPKLNTNYDVEHIEEILKKEEEKTEQATFVFDYREMKADTTLSEKSNDAYIIEVTETEIKNVDQLLKKIDEDCELLQKEIQLFERKIEELEEQKVFQTEEQVKQTDSEIENVKREITSYETAITDMEKQSLTLTEKKQKLIERNRQSKYLTNEE